MARPTGPPRFFCADLPHPRLPEPYCALDQEQTRHARKVLRVNKGEPIELFDGNGRLAQAVVHGFRSGLAWAQVTSVEQVPKPEPELRVAAAMPKGSASDILITSLSQLGAARFTPLRTERSVVDPRAAKLERLEKLALESAKQSGRSHLMPIEPTATLGQAVREPVDLGLVLTPDGPSLAPNELTSKLQGMQRLTLLIGPEGGFTEPERQLAENYQFLPWQLNRNTLRIETAALAAVSVLEYVAMNSS